MSSSLLEQEWLRHAHIRFWSTHRCSVPHALAPHHCSTWVAHLVPVHPHLPRAMDATGAPIRAAA
eukprot:14656980-Heterocapsa_arctica.AAC.1